MAAYLNERGLIEADEWTSTLCQLGLISTDSLKMSVGALQLTIFPPRKNPEPNPPPAPSWFGKFLAGIFEGAK